MTINLPEGKLAACRSQPGVNLTTFEEEKKAAR